MTLNSMRPSVAVSIAYFILSIGGAWYFGDYLKSIGGWGHVPLSILLCCGPILALSQVHGIAIFILTTILVLPLLLYFTVARSKARWLGLMLAIVVWIGIGHWMG